MMPIAPVLSHNAPLQSDRSKRGRVVPRSLLGQVVPCVAESKLVAAFVQVHPALMEPQQEAADR